MAQPGPAADHVAARGRGPLIPRRGLFDLLAEARRATVVSAPAGSGKTSLVRSWVDEADLTQQTAWVSVGREERDPPTFWLSVLDSLRRTRARSVLIREVTAAPELDGWSYRGAAVAREQQLKLLDRIA